MEYPTKRCIDGVYFRVERNGKWESICFTDLTDEEALKLLDDKDSNYLKSLSSILSSTANNMFESCNRMEIKRTSIEEVMMFKKYINLVSDYYEMYGGNN